MTGDALLILLAAISLEVVGQLCFKLGTASSSRSPDVESALAFWHSMLANGWIRSGIAAYAAELALWLAALTQVPLSQAFPMLSLSYCGVALASKFLLGEALGSRGVLGIAVITTGVILVTWPMRHWP
jgi:multidrug transporter EmrE-like cation transporter